jgi:poly(3-hydroxybutyrate) depolymerase
MVITLFAGCAAKTSVEGSHGFGANNFVVTSNGNTSSGGSSSEGNVSLPEDTTNVTFTGAEDVRTVTTPANEFKAMSFNQSEKYNGMCYSYYLPTGAENKSNSTKFPLVFFLHGIGATGHNYNTLSGFDYFYDRNADLLRNSIILSPQAENKTDMWGSSGGTDGKYAFEILQQFVSKYAVDTNRIYIVGTSMGGYGTWWRLVQSPDYFAAAVPCAGRGADAKTNYKKLLNIPIWGWHGTRDALWVDGSVGVEYDEDDATKALYELISGEGGKMNFTSLEGGGHADAWYAAFKDRGLASWMFSQELGGHQSRNYNVIPYLTIKDSTGNTVFSELDASSIGYATNIGTNASDYQDITLKLSDTGYSKLSQVYANSIGKPLTIYFGNKEIAVFVPTKAL